MTEMNARLVTWREVEQLAYDVLSPWTRGTQPLKVWGVPRGGIHVAQALVAATGNLVLIVERPEAADWIVDDLIDSGATAGRYQALYPDKPFVALIDKRELPPEERSRWVVFPWELHETGDGEAPASDNALRLLQSLGVPLDRAGTRDTPQRLVKSLHELTQGYHDDPAEILSTRFPATYDEMIVVREIEFWSLCEHHVLPFHGTATVGYLPGPDGGVVGLSKLARLVHAFSRRLQIQERLTQEIAQAMQEHLKPAGVGVVLRASHLCMAMRGVRTPAEMVTSALLGRFRDPTVRAEFLSLANGRAAG